jgi:HEAT repeat protein
MPKLRNLSFVFVAGAAIGVIIFLVQRTEPRYGGRSLSQWLTVSRATGISPERRAESAAAIRHIGATGLPWLLEWATQEPSSPVKSRVRTFLGNHPRLPAPTALRKWAEPTQDQTKANEARLGFLILGPDAAPAIPELVRIAINGTNVGSATWSVASLANIGPQPLPTLIAIAANTNAIGRLATIHEIGNLGTNARPALPLLVKWLDDVQSQAASYAAGALGELRLDPATSVPALTKCLQNADPQLRRAATFGLGRFGSDAKSAIPAVRSAMAQESDPSNIPALQWALHSIDPAMPWSP